MGKLDKKIDVISIKDLINLYLIGSGEGLYKLSHKDLKSFNSPYLMCVSLDFIKKNPELVKTRKVLLVKDKCGNIAPYINPSDLRFLNEAESISKKIKELHKETIKLTNLLEKLAINKRLLMDEKRILDTLSLIEESKLSSKRKEKENDKRKRKIKHT